MRVTSFAELHEKFGIPYTRKHILALERAGKFPRRVHLGPNSVGWLDSEIEQWLRERAAARLDPVAA